MIEFKDYELDEELTIGLYCFKVSLTSATKNYFLAGTGWDIEEIFRELKVDKYSYIQSIVGYESKGAFPETETLEDLNKVIKQLQIDCLIKEAKEKYPVGIVFKSIFNKFNYISSGKFEFLYKEQVIRDIEVYGVVWHQNEWAEIIPEEPKQPEVNTYGLKVGDEFPANIINGWTLTGNNRYQKNESLGWHMCNSGFIYDRKIESFKNIDGVVGFLVSGTDEVYLRAKGFKEFADSFDKPKFEVGKWYKSNVTSNNCNKFYYLKVLGVEKECPHGQAINIFNGKNYFYNKKHRWMSQKTIEQALFIGPLTDLSEIQQYLPDGHPDKIIKQAEYIAGKWYRMGAWIVKFKELDGDMFRVFKSGTPFDNYKSSDSGYLLIGRQGTPVLITDMTEVYKLFPEEKPNDDDFEVNDWVVIGRFKYGDSPLPQVCQIVEVNKSRAIPYSVKINDVKSGKYNTFCIPKEELRLATPEEVDKELERRWLARGERAAVFSDPGEGVVFENKPITLKSNQADPIVLEDQQVPELTITIKTNKTNKLFINPIKTITL